MKDGFLGGVLACHFGDDLAVGEHHDPVAHALEFGAVSYTHLDVYKRQDQQHPAQNHVVKKRDLPPPLDQGMPRPKGGR